MDTGFGQNLEGYIIRGNLSLEPTDTPLVSGDGSLEAFGTMYVNKISAYSNSQGGVNVSDVILNDGTLYAQNSLASTGFTSASIITNGGVSIRNTTNVIGASAGGALTVFGGTSLVKDVIIGGSLDMSGGTISNISWPYSDYDAVPKIYIDSITHGNVSGAFTPGQVIVASSTGSQISGFDSLMFINDTLTLGTSASIILSSTGPSTFVSYGGGSFNGNLSMSNNRISLVDAPADLKDAVNKGYLLSYLHTRDVFGEPEDEFSAVIESSTTSIIPGLIFESNVKAFIESVYLRQVPSGETTRFILKGVYDEASLQWIMVSEYTGTPTPFIQFNITSLGEIEYINNSSNEYYIKYWNVYSADTTDTLYTVTSISNNINTPTVTGISFPNSEKLGVRAGIITGTDIGYSLHLLTGIQKNGQWSYNTVFIGNPQSSGVVLFIDANGDLLYTNSSTTGTSTITCTIISSVDTGSFEILPPSISPLQVSTGLVFNKDEYTTVNTLLYIKNVDNDKFALYDISAQYFQDTSEWRMTSSYINDNIIQLSLTPSGVLQYTHSENQNLLIRLSIDTPVHVNGLCVTKGGTGRNDFLPGTILRGNGQDSLITDTDLLFYNDSLVVSSTRNNSINTNGGIVCKEIQVNGQIIKISHPIEAGPISLLNNQGVLVDIPGAIFDSPCVIFIATTVSTDTIEYNTMWSIQYMRTENSYFIDVSQKGDISSMTFDISVLGQLSYTSSNIPDWISTQAKFKVLSFN